MKRSGPAPEDFVTPILRRLWSTADGHRQEDLARMLGCERSRISHQLAERQAIPAHELLVWCDFFGTTEPLDAIARRLGARVVPEDREAAPVTVQRGAFALMSATGSVGELIGQALDNDGVIDAHERVIVRSALRGVLDTAEALLARLPERPA